MEEEKAREEAEARRQRILEAANDRLDFVAGVKAKGDQDIHNNNDNDNDGPGEEETSKLSGSAKLAAMRRRRYKKGGTPAKKEAGEESATTTSTTSPASAPLTPVASPESAAPVTEHDTNEKNGSLPTPKEIPAEEDEAQQPVCTVTNETTTEGADKKKYLGVAKMRRKMIKEKQQQQTADDTCDADAAAKPVLKKRRNLYTLPILMHVVTIALLFLVGLDLGLQQPRSETVMVQTRLAPHEHGLKITKFRWPSATPKIVDTIETAPLPPTDNSVLVEDEFAERKTEPFRSKNIDPLFQVDLDDYTRGSGLFFLLGRAAVYLHRINLSIFYFLPLRVYQAIFDACVQLIRTPPMLCLFALAVRQVVGKLILGAKLPDKTETEPQQKDILSMIKSFSTSFAARSFPTLTSLYDTFVHLRADMYVILCGFLVGLAWNHSLKTSLIYDVPVVTEDIRDAAPPLDSIPTEESVDYFNSTLDAVTVDSSEDSYFSSQEPVDPVPGDEL